MLLLLRWNQRHDFEVFDQVANVISGFVETAELKEAVDEFDKL